MGWEDLVQLTSANNFFSDNDGAVRKITTPNVKCGGNRATALFIIQLQFCSGSLQKVRSPLKSDLDGSSSLYLCESDPAGLSHGWELNDSKNCLRCGGQQFPGEG